MNKENNVYKRSIEEEVKYKYDKFNLISHDNKAYKEKLDEVLADCKTRIADLRTETKDLRIKTYETLQFDEHIISQAFQRNSTDKALLTGKVSKDAKEIMDNKMCDNVKKLNLLKYQTKEKLKHLEQLHDQYHQLNLAISYNDRTKLGKTKEGQNIRDAENRLDKLTMKCNEADQIKSAYMKIQETLKKEYSRYGTDLDMIEEEINKDRAELAEVQKIKKDAILARNNALKDLSKKEEEAMIQNNRLHKEMTVMREKTEPIIAKVSALKTEIPSLCFEISKQFSILRKTTQLSENYNEKLQILDEKNINIQLVTSAMNLKENIAAFQTQNKIKAELMKLVEKLESQKKEVKRKYMNARCHYRKVLFGTNSNIENNTAKLNTKHVDKNRSVTKKNTLLHEFQKLFLTYCLCKMWAERTSFLLSEICETDLILTDKQEKELEFTKEDDTYYSQKPDETINNNCMNNFEQEPDKKRDEFNLSNFADIMKKIGILQKLKENSVTYHIYDVLKCQKLETFSELYDNFLSQCPKLNSRFQQTFSQDDIFAELDSMRDSQELFSGRKIFKKKVAQFLKTKLKRRA